MASTVVGPAADSSAQPVPRFGAGPLAGIVLGALCVLGAFIVEGGDPASLILPTPFLIVVGGTIGALLIAHPAGDVGAIPDYIGKAFTGQRSVRGTQVLRNAGTYAILNGLIALLLGAIVILSNSAGAPPGAVGHSVAVALIAPFYGLGLAIVCYALSHRLRDTAA